MHLIYIRPMGMIREKLGLDYLTSLRRKMMVTIRVSTAHVSYEDYITWQALKTNKYTSWYTDKNSNSLGHLESLQYWSYCSENIPGTLLPCWLWICCSVCLFSSMCLHLFKCNLLNEAFPILKHLLLSCFSSVLSILSTTLDIYVFSVSSY